MITIFKIVSVQQGGITKYLFTHNVGADRKRNPVYTTDLEKAKRFQNSLEAQNYYTLFLDGHDKKYTIENYQPAPKAAGMNYTKQSNSVTSKL